MKNIKILLIVLVLAAFCFTGCFSTSAKKPDPVGVRYSFAETDSANLTATMNFIAGRKVGIRFFDCDGVMRPAPSEGTYWLPPILLPAGKPVDLRVYIYWNEDQFGERRRGIYRCPPLQAGKEYKLWFKGTLKGGSIILTYANVDKLTYTSKGLPKFEIVHQQEIPALPKKL